MDIVNIIFFAAVIGVAIVWLDLWIKKKLHRNNRNNIDRWGAGK